MSNPKVITPPTVEPITLDEAHLHLRLDVYDSPPAHPDDPLILGLIPAAREWAEKFTGRSMTERLLEIGLDHFPHRHHGRDWHHLHRPGIAFLGEGRHPMPIRLPGGPVSILASLIYVDVAGVEQTMTDAQFDTYEEPARVLPAIGASWPSTRVQMAAVRVRYWAGYTLPDDSPSGTPLPKPLKQAMLLVLGHLYETREDTADITLISVPMGAEALARPYRLDTALA